MWVGLVDVMDDLLIALPSVHVADRPHERTWPGFTVPNSTASFTSGATVLYFIPADREGNLALAGLALEMGVGGRGGGSGPRPGVAGGARAAAGPAPPPAAPRPRPLAPRHRAEPRPRLHPPPPLPYH
jgi:hypothetical protein